MGFSFTDFTGKLSSAYELAKRIGNSELALEISDLQLQLAELKSAYAELQNENTALKQENDRLKSGKGGSSVGSARIIRC